MCSLRGHQIENAHLGMVTIGSKRINKSRNLRLHNCLAGHLSRVIPLYRLTLGWITRVATSYRYKIDTLSNLKHDLDKKQSERDFSNCFHNFSLLVCCNQGKNVRNCFVLFFQLVGNILRVTWGAGIQVAVHSLQSTALFLEQGHGALWNHG